MRVLGDWLLTPERIAVHLPSGTAVAADLHLGYAEARQRRGEAVPSVPLRETLSPLRQALQREGITRLLLAGDVLEDRRCGEALAGLRVWCQEEGVELVGIVPGNHDGPLASAEVPLFREGYTLGDWTVVHGDRELPAGKVVQGHEHPWARFTRSAGGPCYLVSDAHLVLPAYSRDAAGVNVLGRERWAGYRLYVIGEGRVFDFGALGALS